MMGVQECGSLRLLEKKKPKILEEMKLWKRQL